MTTVPTLDHLLREVGHAWDDPVLSRALIDQALRTYPDAEDAYVAAYRFHFYRNDLASAMLIAEQCLTRICAELNLPDDWQSLQAGGIDFSDPANPRHRFLLFALNAYAYVLARLNRPAEADLAFAVVSRLDPGDRVGAGRLREVLRRGPDPDDAD